LKDFENTLDTVGHNPILRVNNVPPGTAKKNIYLKLECFNPGRSVKDRIALNIIKEAEKSRLLGEKSIIVESSSGNTGIALSMISRIRNYKNIIVIDQNCPEEKVMLLKAFGAIVVMVESGDGSKEDLTQKRIKLVQAIQTVFGDAFIPNQYENPAAPDAHYTYTGQEIVDYMESNDMRFEAIFISVGTGGTITGVSRKIKEYDPSIEIVGIEPLGSTLFGGEKGPYLQQGPGNYFQPKNLDTTHVNNAYKVSDQDAFNMCRRFALEEGILLGGSSGGVLFKAISARRSTTAISCVSCPTAGKNTFARSILTTG